jgi:hypothetical protein
MGLMLWRGGWCLLCRVDGRGVIRPRCGGVHLLIGLDRLPQRPSARARIPEMILSVSTPRPPIGAFVTGVGSVLVETAEGSVDTPEKIPVFLQLGSSTRRTFVSVVDLTLQSLRLLFVEKFQFNPGGDTFPDILVTDRDTGVRYILEEGMQDIIEGTVLTLDVERKPPKTPFPLFLYLF